MLETLVMYFVIGGIFSGAMILIYLIITKCPEMFLLVLLCIALGAILARIFNISLA